MILPDAAVGSIIAAAIAGLVVFISTVLSKEQKTSEFRQVWIDELRKDISKFIAGVSELIALHNLKLKDPSKYDDFLSENFERFHEIQTIEHQIVLRLNPKEHESLILQVKTFRTKMLDAYKHKYSERAKLEDELTKQLLDTTKLVLAMEWKRVKTGEPIYRSVKWGALITLICLGVGLLVTVFFISDKNKSSTTNTNCTPSQLFQYFSYTDANRNIYSEKCSKECSQLMKSTKNTR